MISRYEKRPYNESEQVWIGQYRNLKNISHWHLEHELITCVDGRAHIILDNTSYELNAGECVFCYSGSTHSIDADKDSLLLVCLFNEKIARSIIRNQSIAKPIFKDNYLIVDRLFLIHRELNQKPFLYEQKAEALIHEILIDIFRALPLCSVNPRGQQSADKYKRLLSKIDNEYEFITFSGAAAYMNLSEAYFSKYFKRQSGMTFSQYLNVVRIEKAVELLISEPDIKVTDVMLRCGFDTIRNFNRSFRMITGYTPKSLPPGFVLNVRSLPTISGSFDPTSKDTILVN